MKNDFTSFKDAKKLLEKHKFFGFTAKKSKNNRIEYSFLSVFWPKAIYKVTTLKIENNRVVIGITLNSTELEGWDKLVFSLENIGKMYKKMAISLPEKLQP
jgi:hypothetical protein